MGNPQLQGLTAMQLMIEALESVKQTDNTSPIGTKINQALDACKELAIGLLEIEKHQLKDAYQNSDFETYYNNRFYNQNNK